jgi:hypothetical protein
MGYVNMFMNKKYETVEKEGFMAYLRIISQHSL